MRRSLGQSRIINHRVVNFKGKLAVFFDKLKNALMGGVPCGIYITAKQNPVVYTQGFV